MASSSTTPVTLSKSVYHVFINHRGPDVKKSLASHLYRYLLSRGLTAFLDGPELQVGDTITSQIEAVIRKASVHVAIFSERYAESSWCLNELLMMLKSGAPIIPVFYRVSPADLRWTHGKYSQALHDLEMKKTYDTQTLQKIPRYNSSTIQNWRNALSSVADISGLDLEAFNGDEGVLLDKVVELVLKLVNKTLYVAKYPTGLELKVKDFEATVLLQKHNGMVGIVGLGGVGKTTLAKELFNRKKSNYSRSYFLSDVRESIAEKSVCSLQNQVLEGLFQLGFYIDNSHQGTEMLRQHLLYSQVLLVLDDVDHVDQVDALLPHTDPHSLILITSRDKDVLTRSGVEDSSIYKLTGLNPQHSRELFCSHAFRRPQPLPEFKDLVDKFLTVCHGSPLFLKVCGALLYRKNDISYWQDHFHSLQRTLPHQIKEILKVSYDALTKEEQSIFLDIACFLRGLHKDWAIRILNASGWQGSLGFQNLQNKCLVDLDSRGKIQMHDHVRDLGRHIVAETSVQYGPFSYRSWTQNIESSVITDLRAVILSPCAYDDQNKCTEILWVRGTLQVRYSKDGLLERILRTVQQSTTLVSLFWANCPYPSLPSWIPTENLRLLHVIGRKLETLWPADSQTPNLQLRDLVIDAPLSNIPSSIGKLQHIESIQVSCSDPGNNQLLPVTMLKLPNEFCNLRSLKILVLRGCTQMESLPDSFGDLTNLQDIFLRLCEKLKRLPNSFGNLISLKNLSLRSCHNLTMSTETLGNIRGLTYLRFTNCSKIDIFPPQVAHQQCLEILDLSGTDLKSLPSSIGELSTLKYLSIQCCKDLAEIGALPNGLIELDMFGCSKLRKIDDGLSGLQNLVKLNIGGCEKIEELSSIKSLASLNTLSANGCVKLKSIPGLAQLTKLQKLDVSHCIQIEELPGVEHLRCLEEVNAAGCPKLQWGAGVVEQLRQRLKAGMLVI